METAQKILVIEDNTQLQQLYKLKIESQHYTVFTAMSGDEGVKIAREQLPQLILLDVMLTGDMNGFDTLEVLKRDESLKSIPVIMLTNLDTEEGVARKIGAVDYIVKVNLNIDDLVTKIKQHLPATQ